MNHGNIYKMTLTYCLSLLLILPLATLSNAAPAAQPNRILIDYSDFAAKYLTDCDDIAAQPRPSGERLKRCLTIAKDLRDKLAAFAQRLKFIRQKLVLDKILTKEFETRFYQSAPRLGVDSETLADIKRAGGLDAFAKQSISVLEQSPRTFDLEVKELEAKSARLGFAAQAVVFQTASYEPAAEANRAGRLRTILKIAKKIAVAILAACELAGDACD